MQKQRLISPFAPYSRRRTSNVIRLGLASFTRSDVYHFLLTLSWLNFLLLVSVVFLATNALFGLLYLCGGDCLANARSGSFLDSFFFSVHTIATVGYGSIYPKTDYANWIVTLESLVGIVGTAMITGLVFARFSLPTARVLFSKVAVISPYNGIPTLMFRTANERHNLIVEAQIGVTLVHNETTNEGHFMRRFYDLELVRKRSPVFALSWTVMHPIDASSPLYNATPESLQAEDAQLVISLTGIDETVSQTIHASHIFTADEILWDVRFVDILSLTENGFRRVDYRRFHDVEPVGLSNK
ncbi:ATP-sensitive inward rectifier potassium channel 10 [Merismopedia glauca CCAP 1448/3]|uniref:ATP-sensitive inward rectifier potassium channel 10 n=2 Tax=Merismopedia TaxID=53402 RepID=A0A2T1BYH6_9CYAN|nr:ATP-sensitive inward rectifier potassium channel 10 [Merismopedia glauca CCAP 1448/3]